MGVGAGGTPHREGQTDGRLGGAGGYSTVCSELEGREMRERERPVLPSCRARLRGRAEGEEGVFLSKQPPMAWRKMALHLSVVLLGGRARGRGGGLARCGQRRDDLGCQGGKGCPERGRGCTPLLLPPRAKSRGGGQEDAGEGAVPMMGALGLVLLHPRCRWEPLQRPLLWPWESLRQKQEEKQLEGGVRLQAVPRPRKWRKFKRKPDWKGKGVASGGGGGGSRPPQTSDPRWVV